MRALGHTTRGLRDNRRPSLPGVQEADDGRDRARDSHARGLRNDGCNNLIFLCGA